METTRTETAAVPQHVGIIMDGNGRWAIKRNLSRSAGHKEGLKVTKRIVKTAAVLGIKYLTLYTFSTENWKRPEDEVSFLCKLPGLFFNRYIKELFPLPLKPAALPILLSSTTQI